MNHNSTARVAMLAVLLCACSVSGSKTDHVDKKGQPVACTLTPGELKNRRNQLLPGLIQRAEEVTDLENGLRLKFGSRPGLMAELAGIIDQERTCCSFLRFQISVEPGTGPVVFDVTGPAGTREMLRGL